MEHEQLTGTVIGCAMQVHTILGPGYLESVYQNALAHELRKRGVLVELKKRVLVQYDGVVVGDYEADMLVEDRVLVENKAIRSLTPRDEAQLVNYLTATQLDIGLLLNFGAGRLEFKRKSRTYRAATARQDGQDGQDEQHQGDEVTGR
jgi:GxxExxY protein